MFERLKIILFFVSYGYMACAVLLFGCMMYGHHVIVATLMFLLFCVLLWILRRKVRQCRDKGISLATQVMGDIFFDILMLILFIPAYVEDKQEESWWPLLLMACGWCMLDLLRNVLGIFNSKGEKMLYHEVLSGSVAAVPRMAAHHRYRIRKKHSTRYMLMNVLAVSMLWILLAGLFSIVWNDGRSPFEDAIDILLYLIVVWGFECLGERFLVDGQFVEVVNNSSVIVISMNDIIGVKVDKTFFGRRISIFYGYGKKAVSYPADIDEIVTYLKNRRIDVEIK